MDEVKKFFDRFESDFVSFDGKVISSRYCVPYTAVDSEGSLKLYQSLQEIELSFQEYLDDYHDKGIRSCKFSDLTVVKLGSICFFGSLTWHMLDQKGQVVESWRESYNLIKSNDGLKIFVSIDH